MKLIQQKLLPESIIFMKVLRFILRHNLISTPLLIPCIVCFFVSDFDLISLFLPQNDRRRIPELHLPEREFSLPVVLLNLRLGGIGSAVRREIEFTGIGILRSALRVERLKHHLRTFHPDARHSLQVLFPLQIFEMISCGSAASVSIAEGKQERIQIPHLLFTLPGLLNRCRVCHIGIARRQECFHGGTIHALPVKIIVRKTITVVVGPENFLRHKIFYAAAPQNLRKHSGIPEGVRKPQNPRIHA